jgi:hypothetical protein
MMDTNERALLAGWMRGLAHKLADGEPATADDVAALRRVSRMLADDCGVALPVIEALDGGLETKCPQCGAPLLALRGKEICPCGFGQ